MITQRDIVTMNLSEFQLALAKAEACNLLYCRQSAGADPAGVSRIRNSQDRRDKLMQDAVIGQIGTLAMSVYWTGGVAQYIESRKHANATPTLGDNGSDIWNCDVKTSILLEGKQIRDYHLIVRPHELHEKIWYSRALVSAKDLSRVYLCGWLTSRDLTILSINKSGSEVFGNAYMVPITELNPLPPMKVPAV